MKKENDLGYTRRNIPVEFEDYIAKTFGYPMGLLTVPKSMLSHVKAIINERFTQVKCTVMVAYGRSTSSFYRGDDETPLDFAKRVDNVRYCSDLVSGDKVLTGCPFDEPLPPIPGDAETLGLSNLSPELVKKVAAELLELEKTAKHRVHDEYIYEVDDANRRRIEKLINLSLNYATPIFDLKTLNRSVADVNLAMKKWREALDALFNDPTTIARRYGQKILSAVPKKHAFAKGGFTHETGPEPIIDRDGKTRTAPADLKIETNQQWSPEEFKEWLAKPEQQTRKAYVFREDRAQPGNTTQERKPYFDPDLGKPYVGMDFSRLGGEKTVFMSTSNDGVNWVDNPGNFTKEDFNFLKEKRFDRVGSPPVVEIKVRNYTPDSWPPNAPPYHTPEGWEFEKAMKRRRLKSMLTIEWLEKQQTEKHALVAQRLREILAT